MRANLTIVGMYNYDASVLNNFQTPSGMDKSTIINYILMECGELELLYPDAEIMRTLVRQWSSARKTSWEKLYQSTILKFDMLNNYERYEEWEDNGNGSAKGDSSTNRAAYNTNTMVNTDKGTVTNTTSNKATHKGHIYGNVGVTTPGQMLSEARKDIYTYDVYMSVANEFKQRFCVAVY